MADEPVVDPEVFADDVEPPVEVVGGEPVEALPFVVDELGPLGLVEKLVGEALAMLSVVVGKGYGGDEAVNALTKLENGRELLKRALLKHP